MKYEKYKLLTNEQKEEYNFRFKDKCSLLNIKGLTNIIITMYSIILVLMCICILFIKVEEFKGYEIYIQQILINCVTISGVLSFIILAVVIADIASMIYNIIMEYKWKKINKIK